MSTPSRQLMSKRCLILLHTNLSSITAKASTKPDVLHSWPQAGPLQCCWDPIHPEHWQGWDPVCSNREWVNPEKILPVLVCPSIFPAAAAQSGKLKILYFLKIPFPHEAELWLPQRWHHAIPRDRATSPGLDGAPREPPAEEGTVAAARLSSTANTAARAAQTGAGDHHPDYQPGCLTEKGADSFLQQTSTETTALCSTVFHKASFEYQFIQT